MTDTLNLFRQRVVGFIEWLGAGLTTAKKLGAILRSTQVFNSGLLDMPSASTFRDMKAVIDVTTIFIAARDYLYAIIAHGPHAHNRFAYLPVLRQECLNRVNAAREMPRNQA